MGLDATLERFGRRLRPVDARLVALFIHLAQWIVAPRCGDLWRFCIRMVDTGDPPGLGLDALSCSRDRLHVELREAAPYDPHAALRAICLPSGGRDHLAATRPVITQWPPALATPGGERFIFRFGRVYTGVREAVSASLDRTGWMNTWKP